jgi:hypothetical protein
VTAETGKQRSRDDGVPTGFDTLGVFLVWQSGNYGASTQTESSSTKVFFMDQISNFIYFS